MHFVQSQLSAWGLSQDIAFFLLGLALFCFLFCILLFRALSEKRKAIDFLNSLKEQQGADALNEFRQSVGEEIHKANAQLRMELTDGLSKWSETQSGQMMRFAEMVQQMNAQASHNASQSRSEATATMIQMSQTINSELSGIRETLNRQLQTLQNNNDRKLELMRQTVESKLETTLETRLSESFRQVASQLKEVETGLGEMRALAGEVGELKRVLTNVKSRGTFGEVQLGAILEDILPGHYECNVVTRPHSNERVEFAIRLPGDGQNQKVLMPIDSKFPVEDYLKLQQAQEKGDAAEAEKAAKALETRLKTEAKKIHDKYIEVPYTTEFAILFLPSESLYAECIRRTGVIEELQTKYRITVAGPTVLAALLNSLQMGFRTLAIQERSAEVWAVLGNVKMEFARFSEAIELMDKRVDTVKSAIQSVKTRTSQMGKKLKDVEVLPGMQPAEISRNDDKL